ncbi:MAG: acetate--CoA ligase family protein [Candidatus Micrarchaeia archaeon]
MKITYNSYSSKEHKETQDSQMHQDAKLLDYMQAKSLLEKYGIKSIESAYIEKLDDLYNFLSGIDYSHVVLKAISEKALHKSKAGLVLKDVNMENAEVSYYDIIKRAKPYAPFKILAQRMAKPGIEIVIGGKEDSQFGKLILLGLGGIYVEAFKDFSLRICPIKRYDAKEMIDELKSKDVVTYNGKSKGLIIELLMKTSKLIEENEIKELDLNPIIIREKDYNAVDIRIIK